MAVITQGTEGSRAGDLPTPRRPSNARGAGPDGSPRPRVDEPLDSRGNWSLSTLLLARPGELVSRDEIRHALWGSETFVDFEQGVNHCIKELRAALGEQAEAPRYIQTMPRRGFAALNLRLAAAEQGRLRRRYTRNAEAYEEYLRGRAALVRYTPEGTLQAIREFEGALQRDPQYALARAGLAMACADMYLRFAPASEVERWGTRTEAEARAALDLDPDLAEAHLARAAGRAQASSIGTPRWRPADGRSC